MGVGTVAGATPAGAAARGRSVSIALPGASGAAPTGAAAGRKSHRGHPVGTAPVSPAGTGSTTTSTSTSTSTTSTTSTSATTSTSTSTTMPAVPLVVTSAFASVASGRSATPRSRRVPAVRTRSSAPHPHRASTRQAAARAAAAAAALAPATAVTLPAGIADDCSADVSGALAAWLNGLPAGSDWTPPASACFRIDHGEKLQFPADLTIDGGTFEDLNTKAPAHSGHGTQAGQPAFEILGGADVTLENLRIVGAHKGWSYRPSLAFQAGIQLDGTEDATIANDSITKTFGDGINLEPLRGGSDYRSGGIVNPVENLVVSNVTIKQAGRQGITPASVDGATFTDVNITGVAFNAWDFESDQRNEGAKNVLIDGCVFSGINISMQGPAIGPITMRNCTMPKTNHGDAVRIENTGGKPFHGPIVLADDVLRCAASVYVSCIQLGGASDVTVQDSTVTIGFHRDTIHEAAYTANKGTHVTFTDDVVSGFGHIGATHDGSTATVTGGAWTGKSCRWPAICPSR